MAKKFSTEGLMRNFMPTDPIENDDTNILKNTSSNNIQIEEMVSLTLPEKEVLSSHEPVLSAIKKEKRIPITFNIDESLDERLSLFVFKAKLKKGKKINKTQIITEALIGYLDQNDL